MNELCDIKCEACQDGVSLATDEEVTSYIKQLESWQIIEVEGISRLIKVFEFDNFKEAINFTNLVGEIAEEEDHHPSILTEWGKVTVSWWTHKIGGLHVNDFVMAAKCDKLK